MVELIQTKTVTVTYSEEYKALWMHWEKGANGQDVQEAYREISDYLHTLDTPICVIVDLRANVYMPMKETVIGALFGPYKHPMLNTWLVIGVHSFAQFVATTLTNVTKQDKVAWFKDESEVLDYLKANCPRFTKATSL